MGNQLKLGALLSYATVVFNAVAGLLYTPWMVREIGADNYGLYTLALSVIGFFMLDFGLSDAVTRFLSKYYVEEKQNLVGVFLGMTYKAYLILDAIIAVVFICIYANIDVIYSNLGESQIPVFKVLFVVVALYSIVSFTFTPLTGIFRSNERFVALNACNLLSKVLTVALIVAALAFNQGVYALVAVNAVVNVLFTAIKFILARKLTDAKADFRGWHQDVFSEVVSFSLWVTVSQVCQRLIFSIMPSIIAITATTSEVALFGLAASLEGYVFTVANALNGLFMPKVSRDLVSDDPDALHVSMVKYGRIQLLIVGFIILCFATLGGLFAECWMGADYLMLWPGALLLILPGIVEYPQLIAGTAVIAANKVKEKSFVFMAMAMSNIVFGVVLSMLLGALGACVSIFIAYCIRTAGMNVIYRKHLPVRLGAFFLETYARWLIPAAALLIAGGTYAFLCPMCNWIGFFIGCALLGAVYLVFAWAFWMNDSEKNLLLGITRLRRRG